MYADALLWLIPVVFLAGYIDSIAGGGGLLTVPAYLAAGIPAQFTLGTNKMVSSLGTIVSTLKYIRGGLMLWPVVIVGIPCSLLGSSLGAHWVANLPEATVRSVILFTLPIAAALTLLPKPKAAQRPEYSWHSLQLWTLIPLITFAIGWYDGMFGPGTGSLLILALFGIAKLPLLRCAAVGRLFNLTSNVAAMVTFILHGHVLYHLVIPLAAAGMAGHYLGSKRAIAKGDAVVRPMLLFACALLFAYLLWQHMRG